MQIPSSALAIAVCLLAAPCLPAQTTTLGLFYSFDNVPSERVAEDLRAELTRILAPADLSVDWHSLTEPAGSDFNDLVVLRFHGTCEDAPHALYTPANNHLGETDISEGRVLPFGEVRCDELRRYLAGAGSMGRAMARVAAHEIYHMLTGSAAHARTGIARAEHSRAELAAQTFDFAPSETEILRDYATARARAQSGHQATAPLARGIAPKNVALLRAARKPRALGTTAR